MINNEEDKMAERGDSAGLGVAKIVQLDGQSVLISEIINGDSVLEGEYIIKSITVTKKDGGQVTPLGDNYCIIQFNK